MKKICVGYDDNLGLPSDFAKTIGCDTSAYHDLSQLIDEFSKNNLECVFIPAGTLPYINNYEIIAQAFLNSPEEDFLTTDFVTTEDIEIKDIMNFTLGRVNKYCTTSYWAPMIYLMKYLTKGMKLKFQDTKSFQDMLNKTSQGIIDGSMVWNVILQQNPNMTDKVNCLFSKDNLPAPILVTKKNFPADIIEKINQFKTMDKNVFFFGFKSANNDLINKFMSDVKKSIDFYDIAI